MTIPPIGSMPIPVAPSISMPAIAPVNPPTPARDTGKEGERGDTRPRTPLYDRRGLATGQDKGRLVNRRA